MADSRLRPGANTEPERASRDAQDRSVADDRATTDRQRFIEIMEGALNEALPTLPLINGWHVCWLSTTNQYDTIPKRMRLGYLPVTPTDIGVDYQHLCAKGTDQADRVVWNEMVAFKLPLDKYQAIMEYLHHDRPMEDEAGITAILEGLTDANGRPLVRDVGDGSQDLQSESQRVRAPVFRG